MLLQAMWRRPRGQLRQLMSSARTKAAAGGYQKSVADVIEEDLLAVLEPAMHRQSVDQANARRNRGVSLGAAFGKTPIDDAFVSAKCCCLTWRDLLFQDARRWAWQARWCKARSP